MKGVSSISVSALELALSSDLRSNKRNYKLQILIQIILVV